MPELYGKSIIVERHFSRSGTSGFKIKNTQGKIVSTKKADLEDITDAFALQLDNPMNVLTQDMARQFLNHSTPRDKYKFFVKGTQLEQLDHDYRLLSESLDQQDDRLARKEDDVKILFDEFKRAEEKMKLANRFQSLDEKIRDYSRQFAWAQVVEQEQVDSKPNTQGLHLDPNTPTKILSRIDAEILQANTRVSQRTSEAEATGGVYEDAARVHEQAELAKEELEQSLDPLNSTLDLVQEEFNKNKTELMELVVWLTSVSVVLLSLTLP